ncbi:AMP-binding protein [Rhizobium sp. AQ_MP]|uniref:AMP-binding protein n=1 Tax=Rhizobium sp. AQ_MP TaxID=2761536 RepID=UPI0016397E2F|nr:AMP-binding protein [Rhizobium sp. AQ_MP]MBC2775099.1 AMP-binding protein [Rhizobium sp. AQ_MP]
MNGVPVQTTLDNFNLAAPFWACARVHPGSAALVVARREFTYDASAQKIARLAGYLAPRLKQRRVGVLATRSLEGYVGVLGACMAGATYVPLNQKWPAERLVKLLGLLQLDALIVDRNGIGLLAPEVMAAAPEIIIGPEKADMPATVDPRIVPLDALTDAPLAAPVMVEPQHEAYIIFTSGTTGLPKGVVISAGSLASYLAQARSWTGLGSEDRVAEAHDLTFDLSVHNLFLTLESGAALHVMSALELSAPQHFIRSHGITAWMSVPTIVNMMRATGSLKPGVFETIRLSIFCGEPLPGATVEAWAVAAPNSAIENIYGPTECTVVMLRQTVGAELPLTPGRGVVAIGRPFSDGKIAILGPDLQPVAAGEPGEIALGGPQVGIGYFASPEQTADRFREIGGERWYLTGDLGMCDAEGIYHHLGRTDNQVKVKGNRIELEEVEAHLRLAADSTVVAVVAWPFVDGSAAGLVGFVAGSRETAASIQTNMLRSLPRYMVPEVIHLKDALPVNINGKVDRRALRSLLEGGAS